MLRLPSYFTALAVLAAIWTAAPAAAAQCRANMINGRWAMYYSVFGIWTECLISVRQRRNLSGVCRVGTPDGITDGSVTGILRVNRACSLSGESPSGGTVTGTLQGDGQGGTGIIKNDDGGVHFSLIRRP